MEARRNEPDEKRFRSLQQAYFLELLSRQIEELKGDEGTKSEILQMLQTISRRGNGLVHFVGNYREFSHLPQPDVYKRQATNSHQLIGVW